MSRGAERTTRKLTDQQLTQQNQLISQSNQQGQQDRSLLLPTIQGLLSSTGYTPQQQSDITQQSLGAANTAYDALRESAATSLVDSLKKMGQPTTLEGQPAIVLPLRFADGAIYLGMLPLGEVPALF